MRRYHQQQLLNIINTLNEAIAEMERLYSVNDMQTLIGLLTDCQESAVRIGEAIERLEGEGTKTVSYLEEYCELLYQAGVEANGGNGGADFAGGLRKQLSKIEKSVRDELKSNKMEIVFLPYKAAMFDSMESVWLAAKDDLQCDAYVVPIPYFDRLPDGTAGQMHYEGEQYPDYVPVTDWRKYNIEERHPDVIIIHCPYDGDNYVTSIHPDFYSKRLKGFTDLLVYIPYFVCVDDVEEHFCVCAGTLHADKVIVQSEKVRQTYIREFRKMEEENGCKGVFGDAETKFVALGSPKFDKVLHTKREDCDIPDGWSRLMEGPDGVRKKVVLYNTSIAGLLEGNEKVLNKLKYVFDCFRDRDDAVLLWRPHPLNEAAYRAMRSKLLEDYLKLVGEYRRQGFGIYDDSADLHRAIAVSDAYYGDWGSMVALYQCAGKPVMIQSMDVIPERGAVEALAFENLYDDGESFWFTAFDFNGLFKMDKQTWKAEYLGGFPGEKPDGVRLYSSITENGGKLYFTACSADKFAEYDMVAGEFRRIGLNTAKPRSKGRSLSSGKFYASIPYKGWVFFVGCSYPAFVRYDTATGRLDYFTDWIEGVDSLTSDYDDVYFLREAAVNGACFTVACCKANALVVFDMDKCESTVYEVGSKGMRYSGICFDGRDYWMAPRHDGPVVKWNPTTETYEEYDRFPEGFLGGKYSFWNICYAQGSVWLLPNKANMALKIDILHGNITVADEFQPECRYEKNGAKSSNGNYIMSISIGDTLYAHTGGSNRFIELDCVTGHGREKSIPVPQEAQDVVELVHPEFLVRNETVCRTAYDCYFYEGVSSTLNHLLSYITQYEASEKLSALSGRRTEIFRELNERTDGTSGEAIFAYCKRLTFQNQEVRR